MPDADAPGLVEIRRVLGDDERRDPVRLLGLRVGAGGDNEDLPDAGMRDEDLGAVQHIMVAALDGHRLRPTSVRPSSGLGEPEPAEHFARRKQGHEPLFLLGGPEVNNGRGPQGRVGADGDRMARIDLRELVNHDDVGEVIHPRAAEGLGPRNAEQAELGHLLHVIPREPALEIARPGRRFNNGPREIAHHVADLQVLVGKVERIVHGEI